MKTVLTMFISLVLCWSTTAFAVKYSADLFEMKSNFSKKLFTLEIEDTESAGTLTTSARFVDLEGKSVFEEKSVSKDAELITDEIKQLQTGETGKIWVQDEVIHFEYEKNGKKKSSTEKLVRPFVTTANFTAFVQKNWSEVTTTSGLEMRYGVWFRLDTVGFKIFKVDEKMVGTQKWIHLRMKPSTFIIAALVDPIELWFEQDSKKLMEFVGRANPKLKVGDTLKDLDSEVRYRYQP